MESWAKFDQLLVANLGLRIIQRNCILGVAVQTCARWKRLPTLPAFRSLPLQGLEINGAEIRLIWLLRPGERRCIYC